MNTEEENQVSEELAEKALLLQQFANELKEQTQRLVKSLEELGAIPEEV